MQKLAAYLIERRDGVSSAERRSLEVARCEAAIQEWLRGKHAQDPRAESGDYRSEDGSYATFRWDRAVDGQRSWRLATLDEVSSTGERFTAAVSVTDTGSDVVVYASLEAGLSFSAVAPVVVDPRCPRVVREILKLSGDWYHGPTKLLPLTRLESQDSGEWLAAEIKARERSLPIVLISEVDGEPALPGLSEALAYDLAGLANTFVLGVQASWGLTGSLGKSLSCYLGAVRVFWPRFRETDDPFQHPLWTKGRLLSSGLDATELLRVFRTQLRRMLMDASASSVMRPPQIDEIRGSAARKSLTELRERARSMEDFQRLAVDYADANQRLEAELLTTKDELQRVRQDLLVAEQELKIRRENESLLRQYVPPKLQTIDPQSPNDADVDDSPAPGELRFYKKTGSTDRRDIMVRVDDCGHSAWQNSAGADKAKKGIQHLEGRNDWRTLHHCGSCTGGGLWRAKW